MRFVVDEMALKQAFSGFLRFFFSTNQYPTTIDTRGVPTPLTRQHIILPSFLNILTCIWLAAVFQVRLEGEGHKVKRDVEGFDTRDLILGRQYRREMNLVVLTSLGSAAWYR
jgi:hypothetical protein